MRNVYKKEKKLQVRCHKRFGAKFKKFEKLWID